MFTLKLKHESSGRTRIIECGEVDVVPNGKGVYVRALVDDKTQEFLVSKDGEYSLAFVENATGATTQIIRPPR